MASASTAFQSGTRCACAVAENRSASSRTANPDRIAYLLEQLTPDVACVRVPGCPMRSTELQALTALQAIHGLAGAPVPHYDVVRTPERFDLARTSARGLHGTS